MWKTKSTSYKQYFFGLLFSRNAKEADTDQIYYKLFYSVSKEASHKPLKPAAAKKSFPSVFTLIQLASINIFSSM